MLETNQTAPDFTSPDIGVNAHSDAFSDTADLRIRAVTIRATTGRTRGALQARQAVPARRETPRSLALHFRNAEALR